MFVEEGGGGGEACGVLGTWGGATGVPGVVPGAADTPDAVGAGPFCPVLTEMEICGLGAERIWPCALDAFIGIWAVPGTVADGAEDETEEAAGDEEEGCAGGSEVTGTAGAGDPGCAAGVGGGPC